MKRREFNSVLASSAAALLATPIARAQSAEKYTINSDRLRKSLEALSEYGRNPEGGVSRVAWTEPDIQARRFAIDKLMSGIGLDIRIDAAGSIYGRREGTEKNLPVILFGSHIDSVPQGGNFDGDVGSMSASEIMRTLYEKKIATRHPLASR
jgi:N-carbamoyl-L-amino-acid hydrolase